MSRKAKANNDARRRSQKVVSPVLRIALLLGVAIHLAGFLVFRVISNPLPERDDTEPFIRYTSLDASSVNAAMEERAELFDSAPLFLPTKWNAAASIRPRDGVPVSEVFAPFEPSLDPVAELRPSEIPVGETLYVEDPVDLLDLRFWRFFGGFGESEGNIAPFPSPELIVEARRLTKGAEVGDVRPPVFRVPWLGPAPEGASKAERPARALIRIIGGGYVAGTPLLIDSSGSPEFDEAVLTSLGRTGALATLFDGVWSLSFFPE